MGAAVGGFFFWKSKSDDNKPSQSEFGDVSSPLSNWKYSLGGLAGAAAAGLGALYYGKQSEKSENPKDSQGEASCKPYHGAFPKVLGEVNSLRFYLMILGTFVLLF